MHIETNENTKRCGVWVDNAHSHSYRTDEKFLATVQHCKELGYRVCVYVGGELPLVPVISDLLHAPKLDVAC